MSRIRPPQDEWARINELEARLSKLERSNPFQGTTASAIDGTGQTRLSVGQVSPGVWGMELLDASGNKILQLDDGGLKQYDSSARLRVQAGHLGDGDYGLQVVDTAGNSQEILPAVQQYVDASITISNTAYAVNGGPSVTATVGASGMVLLSASAYIQDLGNGYQGLIGFYLDGTFQRDLLTLNDAASADLGDVDTTRIVAGLSAGSHTFELRYKVAGAGQSAAISARSLVVTPI